MRHVETEVGFKVKRIGLADALGFISAVVAVAWLPNGADTLTPVKVLVLAAGGAGIAPAVAARWRAMGRPTWLITIPCSGVALMLAWGLISMFGSSAPLWDALFGWWGRGDGWLAWMGAAVLFFGAVTLSMREVVRTITWLLGGATIVALIGFSQVVGFEPMPAVGGPVVGTMGNTNFAAGYFAILAMLALGRVMSTVATWQRIWAGVLFIGLAFLAVLTGAKQGPASLGAAIVALGVVSALLYRGRYRTVGLAVVAGVVVVGSTLVLLSVLGIGPLAVLWSERSFAVRQEYWQTALNMMGGRPIFGSGPSGFARYVGEYRTEEYVSLVGPIIRVSAAHNIALQFGAILGFPGLILWLVTFIGSAVALGMRIVRGPVLSIGLTASVAGAFAAYLVQGMVSIDMPPLLATGWVVAGLALASTRGSEIPAARVGVDERARVLWVPITGGALGLVFALLVGTQLKLNHQLAAGLLPEKRLAMVSDRMVPCAIRSDIASGLPSTFSPEIVATVIVQAAELDRRCPPLVQMAAEVAIRQRSLKLAATYTADAVAFDPLLENSWVLRGYYLLGAGDVPSAAEAVVEAGRVLGLYPKKSISQSSIAAVNALAKAVLQAQE